MLPSTTASPGEGVGVREILHQVLLSLGARAEVPEPKWVTAENSLVSMPVGIPIFDKPAEWFAPAEVAPPSPAAPEEIQTPLRTDVGVAKQMEVNPIAPDEFQELGRKTEVKPEWFKPASPKIQQVTEKVGSTLLGLSRSLNVSKSIASVLSTSISAAAALSENLLAEAFAQALTPAMTTAQIPSSGRSVPSQTFMESQDEIAGLFLPQQATWWNTGDLGRAIANKPAAKTVKPLSVDKPGQTNLRWHTYQNPNLVGGGGGFVTNSAQALKYKIYGGGLK